MSKFHPQAKKSGCVNGHCFFIGANLPPKNAKINTKITFFRAKSPFPIDKNRQKLYNERNNCYRSDFMKITKISALLLIFAILLSFSSCKKIHVGTGGSSNNNTNSNEDNNLKDNETDESKVTYVYSVLSKTIHLTDCYHVNRIKEDYKKYTDNIAPLFEKEYIICKDCLVPDAEEPEEDEDDTNTIPAEEATFLINKASEKLHKLDCYHIEGMEEKNILYTNLTLEELLLLEYIPCATCMPNEAKEYEKTHPTEN